MLRRALGRGLAVALSASRAGPAAAASLNVLDRTAGPFLTIYAVAAVVSLLAAEDLPSVLTAMPASRPRRRVLGPAEFVFLAGGRARRECLEFCNSKPYVQLNNIGVVQPLLIPSSRQRDCRKSKPLDVGATMGAGFAR